MYARAKTAQRQKRRNAFLPQLLLVLVITGPVAIAASAQDAASPKQQTASSHPEISVRLEGDKTWGNFETPVLSISIENLQSSPLTTQIYSQEMLLDVDGQRFRWRSSDALYQTTLEPGSTNNSVIVLRLDNAQWVCEDESRSAEFTPVPLAALDPGRHEINVSFTVNAEGFDQPRAVTASCDIEIVSSRFATRAVTGRVLNQAGVPVPGARLLPIGIGQMSFNSPFNESTPIDQIEPVYMVPTQLGFSGTQIQAETVTDSAGRFELAVGGDTRALLVLAESTYPFVFRLKGFRGQLQIRLPATGSLKIEFDSPVPSETSKFYLKPLPPGDPAVPDYWNRELDVLLDVDLYYFLEAGQSVDLDNLPAGRYRIIRSVNRSYANARGISIVVDNRIVQVEADKQTVESFSRKPGRGIIGKLIGTDVDQFEYARVTLFTRTSDYPFEQKYYYDLTFTNEDAEFEFPSAEPGDYLIRVDGLTLQPGTDTDPYAQKTHLGFADFEIGTDANLPVDLTIEMLPNDDMYTALGYDLPLRLVNADGTPAQRRGIQPATRGFRPNVVAIPDVRRTNTDGDAKIRLPHGEHLFFAQSGVDGFRTIFKCRTPVMSTRTIQLNPRPAWYGNNELASRVQIDVLDDSTGAETIRAQIINDLDEPLTLDQMTLYINFLRKISPTICASWYVFLPDDHPLMGTTIAPGESLDISLDWTDLTASGIWTDPMHTRIKGGFPAFNTNEVAMLRVGPGKSRGFQLRSPFEICYQNSRQSRSDNLP